MLRWSLWYYSDAYILVKRTITIVHTSAASNVDKKVIFKNCASFTGCISRINNRQIDDSQYITVVILMYNLIEYRDNYSNASEILRK